MLVWVFDETLNTGFPVVRMGCDYGGHGGLIHAWGCRHFINADDLLQSLNEETLYIPPILPYAAPIETGSLFHNPLAYFMFPHERDVFSLEYLRESQSCRIHDNRQLRQGINEPVLVLNGGEKPLSAIRVGDTRFLLTRNGTKGFLYTFVGKRVSALPVSPVFQNIASAQENEDGTIRLSFLSSDAISPNISTKIDKVILPFRYTGKTVCLWNQGKLHEIGYESLKKGKIPAEFGLYGGKENPFDYPEYYINHCHNMMLLRVGDDDASGTIAFKADTALSQEMFDKIVKAGCDCLLDREDSLLHAVSSLGKTVRLIDVPV